MDILTDESISSTSSVEDEEEHTFQKDTFKTFDSRRQQGLSFTIKWEKNFPGPTIAQTKSAKPVRSTQKTNTGKPSCKNMMNTLICFLLNILKVPNIFNQSKKKVKQILKKGGIVRQMLKGVENKTAKEKQNSRKLVNKFIKTAYFIANMNIYMHITLIFYNS